MGPAPRIDTVRVIGGMRLLIRFTNGEDRAYDCGPLLSRPQFRRLSDPVFFQVVRVDAGGYGVSWDDEIDLSEYELWTNGDPVNDKSRQTSTRTSDH